MKKNFSIRNAVELYASGNYYDLHNYYNMTSVFYEGKKRLRVEFKPCIAFATEKPNLTLVFEGVTYLNFKLDIVGVSVVDELGYKTPNDFDLEWLQSETQMTTDDHFIIRLLKDNYIRIKSLNINLIVLRTVSEENS